MPKIVPGVLWLVICGSMLTRTAAAECSLDPRTSQLPVGAKMTVQVTVTAYGTPSKGDTVTFEVTSGPNSGERATATTDNRGKASFTYTSNGKLGTDIIEASGEAYGYLPFQCTATVAWEGEGTTIALDVEFTGELVQETAIVTATITNGGKPVPGQRVQFTLAAGPHTGLTGASTTDNKGKASFTVPGDGQMGIDTVEAEVEVRAEGADLLTVRNEYDDVVWSSPLAYEAARAFVCVLSNFGRPAENAQSVAQLRALRDQVLANSDLGRRYTESYYKFSPEAFRIMTSHPELFETTGALLDRVGPLVAERLATGQVAVDELLLKDVDALLESVGDLASPEMRTAVELIRGHLADGEIMRSFGFTIPTKKRER